MFVAGWFVPDGHFQNKLRALFVSETKAHFPAAI